MALTALAMAAATAFAQAIAGRLGGEVVDGFRDLVRRRFGGDRRAQETLTRVEREPANQQALHELAQALAHYAGHDPDFQRGLGQAVSQMEWYIDQSQRVHVGRDNLGTITNWRGDVLVDQRTEIELDPIRNASGLPKVAMVTGVLVALVGFAIVLVGMYEWFNMVVGLMGTSSPGPPPEMGPIVQRWFLGFGVFFGGIVLLIIGFLLRPRSR